MNALEATVASSGLPYWWVEAVVIENLDCRRLGLAELWTFDFSNLEVSQVDSAASMDGVVFADPIVCNVERETYKERSLSRMISNLAVPLVNEKVEFMPEGEIAAYHFQSSGNPIGVWDPKLNLSSHMQVLDAGVLWQWDFARFEVIEGRGYGKWVSDYIDLEPWDQVHKALERLRNPPGKKHPGDSDYPRFLEEAKDFYQWIEEIREPFRRAAWQLHLDWKSAKKPPRPVAGPPPRLTLFEDYTVSAGEISTRLHPEPIFFSAMRAALAASTETNISDRNGQGIVARVQAVVMAAMLLEAVANSVGAEYVQEWETYDALPVLGKWQTIFMASGKGGFSLGREPYQTVGKVVRLRNSWLHYKKRFTKVKRTASTVETRVQWELSPTFLAALSGHVETAVIELYEAVGQPRPTWLANAPGWILD